MYTQTYFFPETSNFHTISSPYNVIKNISIFKSYQKKHSPKKPSIVDKMGNIIFDLNKNNNSILSNTDYSYLLRKNR